MTSRREGKLVRQITAEHQHWLDSQPLTITCTICGVSSTGPAGLMLRIEAEHRRQIHPSTPDPKAALAKRQRDLAEQRRAQYAKPKVRAKTVQPLGPTQRAILELLEPGPMRISVLAQHRGVAMGAMGKTLAGLRDRGLVIRQRRGLYARADQNATAEAA